MLQVENLGTVPYFSMSAGAGPVASRRPFRALVSSIRMSRVLLLERYLTGRRRGEGGRTHDPKSWTIHLHDDDSPGARSFQYHARGRVLVPNRMDCLQEKPMTWFDHHHQSKKLASAAQSSLRRGDEATARRLFAEAAQEAEQALAQVSCEKPVTLGVIAMFAVPMRPHALHGSFAGHPTYFPSPWGHSTAPHLRPRNPGAGNSIPRPPLVSSEG